MNLCALWLLVIYVWKCSNVYGASIPDATNARFPQGIVYYELKKDYDAAFHSLFKEVLSEIEAASCLQFREKDGSYTRGYGYLQFENKNKKRECTHKTITKTYPSVAFGYDCLSRRDVLHTVLHALGIPDEVQHTNRDQYLKINWENINPKYVHLFRISPSKSLVDYDPTSVMQFHSSAFSKNGQDTIELKLPGMTINPSEHLSILDKMKLRVMFGHGCYNRKAKNVINTCRKAMESHSENNGLESEGYSKTSENGGSTSDENLVDNIELEEQSSDSANAIDKGIGSIENLSASNNAGESSRVSDSQDKELNKFKDDASENSGTGDDNKLESLSDSRDQSASENSRDDTKEMSEVVQKATNKNSEQDKELNKFKDDASDNSVTSDDKKLESLSDSIDQSATENSRDVSKEMSGVDQKPINEASQSSANVGESDDEDQPKNKVTSDSDNSLNAIGSSNENSNDDKSSNKLSAAKDKITSDNLSNEDASSNNESLGSDDEPVKNKGRSRTDLKLKQHSVI